MAYDIIKGWPDEAALDLAYPAGATLKTTAGEPIQEGIAATIDSTGKVIPMSKTDTNVSGWLLGREGVKNMCTVLIGEFVLECDADHYTGTFVPGDPVSADAGKLFKATGTDKKIGTIISVDGAKIRVYWHV